MLGEKENLWGTELHFHANLIICVRKNNVAAGHMREHSLNRDHDFAYFVNFTKIIFRPKSGGPLFQRSVSLGLHSIKCMSTSL